MSVHVYSRPHGLDAVMPVTEKEQSLVSASDCTITLGSDNAKISDQRGMVTGREFKAAAANTRKSISNTASIANSAKSAANSAQGDGGICRRDRRKRKDHRDRCQSRRRRRDGRC